MKQPIFVLLVFMYATAICFADDPEVYNERPEYYPTALIQLPGAKDVRYYELGGTFQLIYKITCDYPAEDAIKAISDELARSRWRPLKDDFLNPGLPSSHVRGWTTFRDMTHTPERRVHQWLANWVNQNGEVVTYSLRYQYENESIKDLKNLTVIGIFAPAETAKEQREWVLQENEES